MSWQEYVNNLQNGKGQCNYAAICGIDPCSIWAESASKAEFPMTVDDIATVIRAITRQDTSIMGTGIKIGGQLSFTCLRMEPDLLCCQGKGENKDYSLVIALSQKACIVGFNSQPNVKTSQVREAVESIKDYLKNVGY